MSDPYPYINMINIISIISIISMAFFSFNDKFPCCLRDHNHTQNYYYLNHYHYRDYPHHFCFHHQNYNHKYVYPPIYLCLSLCLPIFQHHLAATTPQPPIIPRGGRHPQHDPSAATGSQRKYPFRGKEPLHKTTIQRFSSRASFVLKHSARSLLNYASPYQALHQETFLLLLFREMSKKRVSYSHVLAR